jgi:hypothetical protein
MVKEMEIKANESKSIRVNFSTHQQHTTSSRRCQVSCVGTSTGDLAGANIYSQNGSNGELGSQNCVGYLDAI